MSSDGGSPYSPDWVASRPNEDMGHPISYKVSSSVTVAAKFLVPSGSAGTVKVRGSGGGLTFPEQQCPVSSGSCPYTGSASGTLGSTISNGALSIQWEYSVNNGSWSAVAGGQNQDGTSSNKVYLTLLGQGGRETLLDVACRGNNGNDGSDKQTVLNGIWSVYASEMPAGVAAVKGDTLKYWPNGYATGEYFTTDQLLTYKAGRCGAWADFFKDANAVQTITARELDVNPSRNAPPTQDMINQGIIIVMTDKNGDRRGLVVNSNLDGQGNPNPPNAFSRNSHALGYVSEQAPNTIYDPSYGYATPAGITSLDAAKIKWEDHAVSGVYTWYQNNAGTMQTKATTPFGTGLWPDGSRMVVWSP